MPCSRIVVAVLAAVAVVGIARAEPGDPPGPPDAVQQEGQYAIRSGAESLFGEMLGAGQTLPGGCTLSDGQIDRTSVVATYACGSEQVVLQLLHPGAAPSGAVRTRRFAIAVKRGVPPAGFVDAVAGRIRAREAAFEWAGISGKPGRSWPWPELGAVAALIVVLVFRVVRRRRAT